MIEIKQNNCIKCGHMWKQRKQGEALSCPKCKRYDWNNRSEENIKQI